MTLNRIMTNYLVIKNEKVYKNINTIYIRNCYYVIVTNFLNVKSYYRIVIDPGHSYRDAEEYSKIGPVFTLKDGTTKIYGFKKGKGKDTEYTFDSTRPTGWDYVYKSDEHNEANKVGFIEAALNLEVAKELANLLNNDPKKRFDAYLTKKDHRYMSLKERAKVAIYNNSLGEILTFDKIFLTNVVAKNIRCQGMIPNYNFKKKNRTRCRNSKIIFYTITSFTKKLTLFSNFL